MKMQKVLLALLIFLSILYSCDLTKEEPRSYTLSFNGNGGEGSMKPISMQEGSSSVLKPSQFIKAGYTFTNWNTDVNGNGVTIQDEASYKMGSNNVTLYAQWKLNPSSIITFNANGGEGNMPNQEVTQGLKTNINPNLFSKTNFFFKEWNTDINGNGLSYSDCESLIIGTTNIILYAQWSNNPTYIISFNGNGATSGTMANQTLQENTSALLNANEFARVEYVFNGWNTDINGNGASYADRSSFTIGSSDIELFAQWIHTPGKTITFNPNGGSGVMDTQKIVTGETAALIPNTFTKPGYIFAGWGPSNGISGRYKDKANYTMGYRDVTLNANWIEFRPFKTKWSVTNNKLKFPIDRSIDHYFYIDWGDGNTELITNSNGYYGSAEHTYTTNGEYIVTVSGLIHSFGYERYLKSDPAFGELLDVLEWGTVKLRDGGYQFADCKKLPGFSATDTLDLSNLTNISGMFFGATIFNGDITGWNTTNITDMSWMFYNALQFNRDISGWITINVKDMSYMFYSAATFNKPLISWNTSSVKNMRSMFEGATAFNQPLTGWITTNVLDMSYMFSKATNFNSDITGWNTGKVTDMYNMFNKAVNFNQNISDWNTISVENMRGMFLDASAFACNISNWNTSSVTDMSWMFLNAVLFNSNISGWVTTNVKDMSYMFSGAKTFNQNISGWDTINVINMKLMFADAIAFNQNLVWNTISVTNMESMFRNANLFNGDISNWQTGNVINMGRMFEGATAFNKDISRWNTGNVTDMSRMFYEAQSFNQDLSAWITSSVLDMSNMFGYASAFNSNISSWVTTNVTSMNSMFSHAINFNQDLSSWDVSNADYIYCMFDSASSFNCGGIDISTWNWTIKYNVSMLSMFYGTPLAGAEPTWYVPYM